MLLTWGDKGGRKTCSANDAVVAAEVSGGSNIRSMIPSHSARSTEAEFGSEADR